MSDTSFQISLFVCPCCTRRGKIIAVACTSCQAIVGECARTGRRDCEFRKDAFIYSPHRADSRSCPSCGGVDFDNATPAEVEKVTGLYQRFSSSHR